MPGSRKSNGKNKGAGKAAGASSSARSQSTQQALKPFTHSFAVQEPNTESTDAIDDGASDASLEPIFEGLRNFPSATPTSNSFTTPDSNFAVQEPDTESADIIGDGASDVSLEPIYEGLETFSSATSASNSTFNHPTTTAKTNGNINRMQNMIKGMACSLPSSPPQVAPEDDSFVDYATNLLASIPITAGRQSQTTTADLPAHIVKLISSLPAPPATPLPPTAAEWRLILRPLIPSWVNNYSSFTDVLEGSSSGLMKKRSSVKSVGKMIKRLVLPGKKSGGLKKEKKKRNKKMKLDPEEMDEQALLAVAMKMSLTEDRDDQALLDRVLEESLVDRAIQESALDMRIEDPDLVMTEAQYVSTKLNEWVSENQVNFGAATSSTLQSHQPVTEASATAPFDPALRLRLELIAKDALALMEKQEDEFAAGMISVISPTPHQSLPPPASPATSSTSADNIFIREGPFHFKGLPLSVRNEIYKLLVVIHPAAYATTSPRTRRQLRLEPHIPSGDTAIFFANKQISEESRAVFYAFNFFTIGNGRYGVTDQANLHGLEEFAKIVPRRFRRMIRNVEMQIVLPMGWLNEKRSGLDRDREERHVQTKLLGLGKLLRRKFRGVEHVRVEFRTDGSLWGSLQAWTERLPFEIEVSKEEKLNTLRGLIQLPGLHTVRVGNMGPMSINSAFMGIAQEIVDENDATGSGPEEKRERGTVMQVAETVEIEVMGDETIEKCGMVVDAETKEDIGSLLKDTPKEEEHVEGGLLDEAWENPYAVEGDQMQIELRDNDTAMGNTQTEEESVMACFGIEG
ncbi:hypothetical protein DL95DRAFT_448935 [Leptodontidium sp. 2 PMI_412]|nr:hypothetical protein DL95DRAFT_448935 [Leptodontidium sp. 2 PMI_412]